MTTIDEKKAASQVLTPEITVLPADLNRKAWNAVTKTHRDADFERLVELLCTPEKNCLSNTEMEWLVKDIGIQGKSIAQIACNNGRELMSLKKLGANTCIGFDISDAVIEYAKDLSRATNIDCEFIRSDIYEIDEKYNKQFDIVYITVGAFGWFPDIKVAFAKIKNLLKPGGVVFIFEMHPILDMYMPDNECTEEVNQQPKCEDSYFRTDPFISEGGLNYITQEAYAAQPEIWFHHKMSDIIQAGLDNGLILNLFRELAENISLSYKRFNEVKNKPPLSYVLVFNRAFS